MVSLWSTFWGIITFISKRRNEILLKTGLNVLISYLIIRATVNSSFKNGRILDTFTSRGLILQS